MRKKKNVCPTLSIALLHLPQIIRLRFKKEKKVTKKEEKIG